GVVNPVTIELPGTEARQVDVPDLVGVLRQANAGGSPPAVRSVKQAQFDLGGVLRKEREIHAAAIPGGAERVRLSKPHVHSLLGSSKRSATGKAIESLNHRVIESLTDWAI